MQVFFSPRHQIDVSTLPAGIYFLRIELEDGRHGVKRLIKQ
ncbi:MAG: T9SS type A sorting domain-containing protein [Bacteroidota bacterium]